MLVNPLGYTSYDAGITGDMSALELHEYPWKGSIADVWPEHEDVSKH